GNTLIDRVLSAAAEAAGGGPRLPPPKYSTLKSGEKLVALDDGTSAAAPSAGQSKEESDGPHNEGDSHTPGPLGVGVNDADSDAAGRQPPVGEDDSSLSVDGCNSPVGADADVPQPLTHDQRVAIAQAIKDTEWNRQWHAGDTGNQWIAELGESAEQYLSDFGYQPESLANILRVCAAIPPALRRQDLRFSHHVVVYRLNHEDIEMWLEAAQQEQWSVRQLREAVHGVKERMRRWSTQQLREFAADNHYADVLAFIDALEAVR
ncbi:hypothetical protein LCGC14_2332570, partial [marine sediment metagenome]